MQNASACASSLAVFKADGKVLSSVRTLVKTGSRLVRVDASSTTCKSLLSVREVQTILH